MLTLQNKYLGFYHLFVQFILFFIELLQVQLLLLTLMVCLQFQTGLGIPMSLQHLMMKCQILVVVVEVHLMMIRYKLKIIRHSFELLSAYILAILISLSGLMPIFSLVFHIQGSLYWSLFLYTVISLFQQLRVCRWSYDQ